MSILRFLKKKSYNPPIISLPDEYQDLPSPLASENPEEVQIINESVKDEMRKHLCWYFELKVIKFGFIIVS